MNPVDKIIVFLAAINVASLCFYAMEYYRTGEVVATSGLKVKGYHELPAMIAFLACMHQVFYSKKRGGWHALVGKIAILASVVCLALVTPNLGTGVKKELLWVDDLKRSMKGNPLLPGILVWNEAVNIHQFMMYGLLLLNQLFLGWTSAKRDDMKQHAHHMRGATLLLLGPLSQRFLYNHCTEKNDQHAIFWQIATYSALMVVIDKSIVRFSLRATLFAALCAAVYFVYNDASALQLIERML